MFDSVGFELPISNDQPNFCPRYRKTLLTGMAIPHGSDTCPHSNGMAHEAVAEWLTRNCASECVSFAAATVRSGCSLCRCCSQSAAQQEMKPSPARFALPGIDRDTRAPSVRLDAGPLSKPETGVLPRPRVESALVREYLRQLRTDTLFLVGGEGRRPNVQFLPKHKFGAGAGTSRSASRPRAYDAGRALPRSFGVDCVRDGIG